MNSIPKGQAAGAPQGARPLYAAVVARTVQPEDRMAAGPLPQAKDPWPPKPQALGLAPPVPTPQPHRRWITEANRRAGELEQAIALLREATTAHAFAQANEQCCTLVRNLTQNIKSACDAMPAGRFLDGDLRGCLHRYATCQVSHIAALLHGRPSLRHVLTGGSVIAFDEPHRPKQLKLTVLTLKIALPADNGILHDLAQHTGHLELVHDIGRFHQRFAHALRSGDATSDRAPAISLQVVQTLAQEWDAYGEDLLSQSEPLCHGTPRPKMRAPHID